MSAAPDAEVPWLTDEQLRDWKSLIALLATLPSAIDAQLKCESGINTFEYHVLAALSGAPQGTLPMSALAMTAQGSLSRLSHAVSRLERAGWVERRNCTVGGRGIDAHLTEAGWAKVRESAPGHVRQARRLVVDALTAAQLHALGDAARTVVAAIDPRLSAQLERDDAR